MKKRGKRLGKKAIGHDILLELFQIIASMTVLISELSFTAGAVKQLTIEKNIYSRDLSVLLDMMYATPQNFQYLYAFKVVEGEMFNLNISDFTVGLNTKTYKAWGTFEFYENKAMNRLNVDEGDVAGYLRIFKEGTSIRFAREGTGEMHMLSCAQADTQDPSWKKNPVILDPAFGGDEKGDVNKDDPGFFEAQQMRAIASAVKLRLPNSVFTRETENPDIFERISTINENQGIVISLHTDKASLRDNLLVAYFNGKSSDDAKRKSAKLGCMIINSILSNGEISTNITGVAVAPAEMDIIPEDRIGVLLALGNMDIPRERSLVAEPNKVAQSIYKGIEDYYK